MQAAALLGIASAGTHTVGGGGEGCLLMIISYDSRVQLLEPIGLHRPLALGLGLPRGLGLLQGELARGFDLVLQLTFGL